MDDILKSIRAHLYDRTSSPLFGAFVFAWLGWNYEFVLVILDSSMDAHEKIDYISLFLYADFSTHILKGFINPLVTALAFIYIYPIPAKYIFKYAREQQKFLKSIRQKIDDETPLTNEESRKLRRDIEDLKYEYNNELMRLQEENKTLKSSNTQLRDEIKNTPIVKTEDAPKYSKQTKKNGMSFSLEGPEVSEIEKSILLFLANKERASIDDLKSNLGAELIITQYSLDGLLERKLVEHDDIVNPGYYLTKKGRALVVESGLRHE